MFRIKGKEEINVLYCTVLYVPSLKFGVSITFGHEFDSLGLQSYSCFGDIKHVAHVRVIHDVQLIPLGTKLCGVAWCGVWGDED